MSGKAYANKKKKKDRPVGDFYSTPKSLVWVAEDIIEEEFKGNMILEPCCGNTNKEPIVDVLHGYGYYIIKNDLNHDNFGYDYLKKDKWIENQIITNPPFSLWDDFVVKAKTHCKKFMFIGRLNYIGTDSRLKSGIWENLKAIYPFSRYVDYQTPYREDGLFHVGAMATAWFLWDMEYEGDPTMKILDVQKYAKLGAFKI